MKELHKQSGKKPEDGGKGLLLRRELNASRHKARIVEGKIKKHGRLGRIPMGAGIRVYNEDSDDDASSSSSSDSDSEKNDKSVSLFSSVSGS